MKDVCRTCNSEVIGDPIFHLCPTNYDEIEAVIEIFNAAAEDETKCEIRRRCQERIAEMRNQ